VGLLCVKLVQRWLLYLTVERIVQFNWKIPCVFLNERELQGEGFGGYVWGKEVRENALKVVKQKETEVIGQEWFSLTLLLFVHRFDPIVHVTRRSLRWLRPHILGRKNRTIALYSVYQSI